MPYAPIPGVIVIGLGHRARHGKDTIANVICHAYPEARRYSFADDLKAYCRIVHQMVGKDAPLLQRVGMEWREKDPEVWVRSVYGKIAEERPMLAILTDVRFPNELDFVKQLGGTTIRVTRYQPDGSMYVDPSRPADHPSEIALADASWDIEIYNSSDVASLETIALHAIDDLLTRQQMDALEQIGLSCHREPRH